MIPARLKRLARMDAAEIRWRIRAHARSLADRVAIGLATPRWERGRLLPALAPLPELAGARSALRQRDWEGAHAELSRHFAHAPQRFVISPGVRTRVADSVRRAFPDSAGRARAAAGRILTGHYDLLGYRGLRFDPADPAHGPDGSIVDWHLDPVHGRRAPRVAWPAVPFLDASCGDHKVIWELNRHQHWLTLGRAFWLTGVTTFRDRFVAELADWLRGNPPLLGINWASMLELAFRSISWVWALNFFVDAEGGLALERHRAPWVVDLLLALDLQMTHVERHLSRYFSPNTHLLGEALALYVCGLAVPELTGSGRRVDTGRRILLEEADRQIGRDGGHLERSTHYHRYALDFYLLALTIGRIHRDPAAAGFERAVARLAAAARLLADDRGRVPHIGDDDGGMLMPITKRRPDDLRDSLAIAARLVGPPGPQPEPVPEEGLWLLAHETFADARDPETAEPGSRCPRPTSAALEETGYYVSRTAWSDHLVIDGGPLGYQNGGHAHADALSLTFSVSGVPLLIDPGTGSYTADAGLRDRFRSTALHNTVVVDGRSSSVPDGPFHWWRAAGSQVLRWRTAEAFDYFDGTHDGYGPLLHRRRVLAMHGDLLIVADTVDGTGTHEVATHWHIDPAWSVRVQGRHATFSCGTRRVALVIPEGTIEVFTADHETGLGWCSPEYGRIEPATTLRVSRRGALPLCTTCVIGLDQLNGIGEITRLAVPADTSIAHASGIRIARDASVDYMLIAEPRTAAITPSLAPVTRIGDVETDARMLFYRSADGRPITHLAFVDGSLARSATLHVELPREVPQYFARFEDAACASRGGFRQKRDDRPCVA